MAPYNDNLAAAHAALRAAQQDLADRDQTIRELQAQIDAPVPQTTILSPDASWAEIGRKAWKTGAIWILAVAIVSPIAAITFGWSYLDVRGKEAACANRLARYEKDDKSFPDRTVSVMVNEGRITIDLGEERLVESLPADGNMKDSKHSVNIGERVKRVSVVHDGTLQVEYKFDAKGYPLVWPAPKIPSASPVDTAERVTQCQTLLRAWENAGRP